MTTQQLSQQLPPPDPPGIRKWLRDNLFNGWFNILLTIFAGFLTFFLLYNSILWAVTKADWRPITEFPVLFAVGQYPRPELWRVGVGIGIIVFK